MPKSTFRKSAAIVAGLALAGSGLVAAPANAAISSLTVSPLLGSGYTTVLGATFNMKLLAPGNAGEVVDFYVEGATAAQLTVNSGTAATSFTSVPSIATGVTDVVVGSVANFPLTSVAGNYVPFSVSLDDSLVTATTTITITPFVDSVLADNKPTAGEVTGTPVQVTFLKASGVTATVSSLELAPLGETDGTNATTAVVTLDGGVNMADTVGGVGKVAFKLNGGTATNDSTVAYDVTEAAYVASVDSDDANITDLADGDVVSAQAFVEGEAVGGPVKLSGAVGGEVASLADVDALPGSYYLSTLTYDSITTADAIRVGAGEVTFYTVVTPESGYSKAGQPVKFTIKEASVDELSSTGSITAGGKTLTNSSATTAQSITVDAVSGATGVAAVTVSYTGLKNTEQFVVSASAVGEDAASAAAMTVTVINSYAATISSNVDGGDGTDAASYAMVKQTAGSVTFTLADHFGMAPVGTFRANAQVTGGTVINQQVTFASGAATLNWTDNSDDAASRTITLDLEKLGTSSYADVSPAESYTAVLVEVLAAAQSPARVTVTNSVAAGSTQAILGEDFVTGDKRNGASAQDWNTDPTANLTGTVYSTTGGAAAGASVTVAAPGVLFTNAAKTVYSEGSITVRADAAGQYKVFYASNTAGKATFTITSGSATNTTSTTFAGVAADDVDSISFAGTPTTAAPGTTFKVTVTMTDAFGNPVKVVAADTPNIAVYYSGPGIVFGTLPSETDANGQLSFSVLLGGNDTGTGVVTVTYDVDGDGSLLELDVNNFSVQHSIVVGTAGNTGDYSSWTKKLDDNSAKIYAKNVVGEGKVQFFLNGKEIAWVRATSASDPKLRTANGSAYLVRTVEFAEGKNVLEVYVDGVRTTRTAYTK